MVRLLRFYIGLEPRAHVTGANIKQTFCVLVCVSGSAVAPFTDHVTLQIGCNFTISSAHHRHVDLTMARALSATETLAVRIELYWWHWSCLRNKRRYEAWDKQIKNTLEVSIIVWLFSILEPTSYNLIGYDKNSLSRTAESKIVWRSLVNDLQLLRPGFEDNLMQILEKNTSALN